MSKYITDKRYFMILLLLILLVIFAFVVIIFWSDISGSILPLPTPQFTPTITPTPTELPTNFPNVIRDYFENQNGTNGVLAGSVVLVLIILLGVLISIRNNEK
ncbi:MAG: hypothetical protein IJI57_02105 [Flexilinea sp.]|nr:hypothetical protein [Flexilinea sp.]